MFVVDRCLIVLLSNFTLELNTLVITSFSLALILTQSLANNTDLDNLLDKGLFSIEGSFR